MCLCVHQLYYEILEATIILLFKALSGRETVVGGIAAHLVSLYSI